MDDYESPNQFLSTYKPPKQSILDKLSGCLITLCLLIFLTSVFDLGGLLRIVTVPLQVIICPSALK